MCKTEERAWVAVREVAQGQATSCSGSSSRSASGTHLLLLLRLLVLWVRRRQQGLQAMV
jgi:hypothetical protein